MYKPDLKIKNSKVLQQSCNFFNSITGIASSQSNFVSYAFCVLGNIWSRLLSIIQTSFIPWKGKDYERFQGQIQKHPVCF
jgi:hypothetical protein